MLHIDLTGKIAIVTGGGKGLGRGIAIKLAEAGADVVIADIVLESARKVAAEVTAMGRKSKAVLTDVTREDDVMDLVDGTVQDFGKLDIMCNNAGIVYSMLLEELPSTDYDKLMAVNVKGVFHGIKAALKYMKPQKSGKIINTASNSGKEGVAMFSHYCASKFAVVGMTQAAAREAAPYNININAICPGIVRTDIWNDLLADGNQELGNERLNEYIKLIPLGRPQTPEDIGGLVAFLASEMSMNITGQAINISGGRQVH